MPSSGSKAPPFEKFTVYYCAARRTSDDGLNENMVEVWAQADYLLSLDCARFVEDAIREKLERERKP